MMSLEVSSEIFCCTPFHADIKMDTASFSIQRGVYNLINMQRGVHNLINMYNKVYNYFGETTIGLTWAFSYQPCKEPYNWLGDFGIFRSDFLYDGGIG